LPRGDHAASGDLRDDHAAFLQQSPGARGERRFFGVQQKEPLAVDRIPGRLPAGDRPIRKGGDFRFHGQLQRLIGPDHPVIRRVAEDGLQGREVVAELLRREKPVVLPGLADQLFQTGRQSVPPVEKNGRSIVQLDDRDQGAVDEHLRGFLQRDEVVSRGRHRSAHALDHRPDDRREGVRGRRSGIGRHAGRSRLFGDGRRRGGIRNGWGSVGSRHAERPADRKAVHVFDFRVQLADLTIGRKGLRRIHVQLQQDDPADRILFLDPV